MDCKICFERFTRIERQPNVLIPCGHTVCLECLNKLKIQKNTARDYHDELYYFRLQQLKCPTCRQEIKDDKPNYAILDLLDCNLIVDPNGKLKQELTNELTNLKISSDKLTADYKNKRKEVESSVRIVKKSIYSKTEILINLLMVHQDVLLREADEIQKNELETLDNLTIDSVVIPTDDINSLSITELQNLKKTFSKLNTDLSSKTKALDGVDVNYELKSHEHSYLNMIGFIKNNNFKYSASASAFDKYFDLTENFSTITKDSIYDSTPIASSLSSFSLNCDKSKDINQTASSLASNGPNVNRYIVRNSNPSVLSPDVFHLSNLKRAKTAPATNTTVEQPFRFSQYNPLPRSDSTPISSLNAPRQSSESLRFSFFNDRNASNATFERTIFGNNARQEEPATPRQLDLYEYLQTDINNNNLNVKK